MPWISKGGRFKANLPNGCVGGERYKIQIQDTLTGELMERSAYRTSEKWGYLQDFKLQFRGKRMYLSDILEIPMPTAVAFGKKGRSNKKPAPLRIIGVYDNGGKTADRYTVVFNETEYGPKGVVMYQCVSASRDCHMPNGVFYAGYYSSSVETLGKKIKFSDLPETVQNCVRKWRE